MTFRKENDLKAFFEPQAVAAVGSLREMPGTAYWIIRNMHEIGFGGAVYAVNPNPEKYGRIFGSQVYASVTDIDGPVDLAAVITPPATVPGIVEECVHKGIKAVIVMTEGFAESGGEGIGLQDHLRQIVRDKGVRIMGPNTFGVVNTANRLVTVPPYMDQDNIKRGGVAFCSQTGSGGPHQVPLWDWAYPISKMCDIGNKCDVDEVDIINYLAEDSETKVVALHLEDIRHPPRFMAAARKLIPCKPLVVLKTGRSKGGAKAAFSHTGSMMGSDKMYHALLRQAGAIRVKTWQELWEVPKTLVYQPLSQGNRFAVITFTGGQGVIAADAAEEAGLELADFTPETRQRLCAISPRLGGNPVDIGPVMSDSRSQSADNPFSAVEKTVPLVLADPNVDCLTISFFSGRQVIPMHPMIVEMLQRLTGDTSKTVNMWLYGTNTSAVEDLGRRLQACGLPAHCDLDMAVKALGCSTQGFRIRSNFS